MYIYSIGESESQFRSLPKRDPFKGMKQNLIQDISPLSVSADPGTGYQWHHTVIRKTAALPVLSLTPPTVAVIDTGVDYTHPDLLGKVILGYNVVANNFDPYDDAGHGTHVAGIIAARAGNASYGEGVCPNCKILAVKVLGADGSGSWFDVAQGMSYARIAVTTPPTRVINMSLGGGASSLIAAQVDLIKAAGKVLVAAAGNCNNGSICSTAPSFPGADPDVALRVMSTETNDCRSFFSNFSPSTNPVLYNIAAPGSDIMSTTPNAGYESFSGTSMASPVVAGSAALVWGQLPALTRDGLVSRILTTGQPVSCGFAAATKRVDVRKAILGTSEVAIVGRVLDPFTGKAPSPVTTPKTVALYSGATLLGLSGTNSGGSYAITGLTAGTLRNLRGSGAGYVSAILRYPISIASVAGPYNDALPKLRPTGNATVTLDWRNMEPVITTTGCGANCNGTELDLFVKLPSGGYIYWGNPGDLAGTPFVIFPRDSINDLKPLETIVIGSGAANGVYKVFADNPNIGSTQWNHLWTGSGASAQFFNGAASIGPFYVAPPATCAVAANRFWYVANLTKSGTTYTVTNVNICSTTPP
ncbi:MAG: S8 family serine peptidase [Methylococcales bacterium]|nr:S8 family serine peptidase [Methylococcales bacterium]